MGSDKYCGNEIDCSVSRKMIFLLSCADWRGAVERFDQTGAAAPAVLATVLASKCLGVSRTSSQTASTGHAATGPAAVCSRVTPAARLQYSDIPCSAVTLLATMALPTDGLPAGL